MDPEACLQRAETAREDGDRDECREALSDLGGWIARGGFKPSNADARIVALQDWLTERSS